MGIHYVATFSVNETDRAAIEELLRDLARHLHARHPLVRSARGLRQQWGPLPRRGYQWTEEFDDLDAMTASACEADCPPLWHDIHRMATAGPFLSGVFHDVLGDDV